MLSSLVLFVFTFPQSASIVPVHSHYQALSKYIVMQELVSSLSLVIVDDAKGTGDAWQKN